MKAALFISQTHLKITKRETKHVGEVFIGRVAVLGDILQGKGMFN